MNNIYRTLCFVTTALSFLSNTGLACDVNRNGSWNDRDLLGGDEISKITQIRVFEGQYSVFRVVQRLETTYLLSDGQTTRTICHGDSGGTLIRTLNLVDGEYVKEMHISYGAVVDHVRFVTNLGTDTGTLGGGGGLGSSKTTFSKKGFYIQALVGASAGRIDRLDEPIYQAILTTQAPTGAPAVMSTTLQPTAWPTTATPLPTRTVTKLPTSALSTKAPVSIAAQPVLDDKSNSIAIQLGIGAAVVVVVVVVCVLWAWNRRRLQRMDPPDDKSDQDDEPVAIRAYAVQSHAIISPSSSGNGQAQDDCSAELLEAQVLPMTEESAESTTRHDAAVVAVVVAGHQSTPADQNLRDFRNKTRRTGVPSAMATTPMDQNNLQDFKKKTKPAADSRPKKKSTTAVTTENPAVNQRNLRDFKRKTETSAGTKH